MWENECPKFLNIPQIFRLKKPPRQNTFLPSLICLICVLSLPRLSPPNVARLAISRTYISFCPCSNFILYLPLWKQYRDMTNNAAAITLCRSCVTSYTPFFVPPEVDKHNFISTWILYVDWKIHSEWHLVPLQREQKTVSSQLQMPCKRTGSFPGNSHFVIL